MKSDPMAYSVIGSNSKVNGNGYEKIKGILNIPEMTTQNTPVPFIKIPLKIILLCKALSSILINTCDSI